MVSRKDNLAAIEQQLLALQADLARLQSACKSDEPAQSTEAGQLALNTQMGDIGQLQFECAHLEVLLQRIGESERQALTAREHVLFQRCQDRCQTLRRDAKQHMGTLIKIKRAWHASHTAPEEGALPSSDDDTSQHGETITSLHVSAYDAYREIMKTILPDIMAIDTEQRMRTAGRRLEVMDGQSLFLETTHEMDVFMDYAMFQIESDGKNVVQRHYALRRGAYSVERLAALTALVSARFSLLTVVRACGDEGAIVYDPLRDEQLLLIDRGLCQMAKKQSNYAVLTHYMRLPEFAMTTGASTPIQLNSDLGRAMQQTLQPLIGHHQGTLLLDERDRKQIITELFKMAIHGDAAKAVTSKPLPMHAV